MIFDIELFLPTARPGAAADTESLGECKILTHNIFVTVTEHNGDAHLIALNDLVEVDLPEHRYVTAHGRTLYPRQMDLPDRLVVETGSGHVRTINGVQIAKMVRSKRDSPGKGVSW